MILHKILRGERAGVYLPFALSRLRALERINKGGFFTQKFELDGYSIEVQQAPPFQYIRIVESGAIQFEFFASDHVDGYFYSTPGYRPFEIGGIGAIQGGGLRATFRNSGRPSAKPLYHTLFTPDADGPQWASKEATDVGMPLATKSQGFFKTWATWQAQRVGESVWFPDNKPDSMVVSTWGTPQGRCSMAGWGDYFWPDVIGALFPPYDIYYDLAPTLYTADGGVYGVIGPYLGDNCWWRHAAMQTVEGRRFFILGDNKGRLHVYPVKKYHEDATILASLRTVAGLLTASSSLIEVKTVTPPYPAWVTMPVVDELDPLLWWNWNFNKDATKAATCALHEDPRAGYSFYTDTYDGLNVSLWRAFLDAQFNDAEHAGLFHTSKKGRAPRVLTPGLVEIGIEITVTGSGDMDFDVDVNLLREDYFGDSGRYYVDTGYLYADPRINNFNNVENSLPEDTLVTAELQCYSTDGTWWTYKDLDPDMPDDQRQQDEEGNFIFNAGLEGDFGPYVEGRDLVGALPTVTWVIRRQDTNAELHRQLLSVSTLIGDWFFPLHADTTQLRDNGYSTPPTTQLISGIWIHNQIIDSEGQFFNNGPATGPAADGTYRYGVIAAADLRSLSWCVGRNHISFTGTPFGDPPNWLPDTQTQKLQYDLYAFGEKIDSAAFKLEGFYPDPADFLAQPAVMHFEDSEVEDDPDTEPAPEARVAFIPQATPVWGACAINFLGVLPYIEIKAHPKGHLSFCRLDGGGRGNIDVLRVRTKDGRDLTSSHRDVFNRAFATALPADGRPVSFYDGTGNLGYEAGSFRLTGFWLPYKETQ